MHGAGEPREARVSRIRCDIANGVKAFHGRLLAI
jgi:hypothetical protein